MSNSTSKQLQSIIQKYSEIETLETRNSDSLDFHELSVWQIKELMEAAYNLGMAAGFAEGVEEADEELISQNRNA